MKFVPAAKHIVDFEKDKTARDPFTITSIKRDQPSVSSVARHLPGKWGDSYARGLEDGKTAAREEMQQEHTVLRQQFEQELALERCTWATREAEILTQALQHSLHELEGNIANAVSRILKPFLTETLKKKAIADLMETLDGIIKKDEGITLEISGPDDLLQRLREKLANTHVTALFSPRDEIDVTIKVGQTNLATQIQAWIERLEERTE